MHINTSIPTQIESGAQTIASITDDFDGDTRNATTPDVGADEYTATTTTFPLSVNILDGWNMVSITWFTSNKSECKYVVAK